MPTKTGWKSDEWRRMFRPEHWEEYSPSGTHPEWRCTWARLGARVLESKTPVPGRGLGTRPELEEPGLDRQGGVGRASEKGGRDLLGFQDLGPRSGKTNFPQLRLGWRVGDKVFITGTIGDSSFRSTASLGWGVGGRTAWPHQAGMGVLGVWRSLSEGVPGSGGTGSPHLPRPI